MPESTFAGDKKEGKWLLAGFEKRWVPAVVPYVPRWLQTYHLTLLTLVWSGAIIVLGAWATQDIRWLWGVSAMILLQYITDALDGAIGRSRNTGLIRWGYYMDHLLDYVFLASLFLAYAFVIPADAHITLLWLFIVAVGFMVSSYLAFAATNQFRIATFYLGPTEGRILFIIVNTLIIVFGPFYFFLFLPAGAFAGLFVLGIAVARRQAAIWRMDMETKKKIQ